MANQMEHWVEKSKLVLIGLFFAGALVLVGCGRSPTSQGSPASPQSSTETLEIVEVLARAEGQGTDASARPTFPNDTVEVAIKTKGSAADADLSVKMIYLADGSAVGTRDVRLNASSAATQSVRFEPTPDWKPGRYLFEVSVSGKLAGSQELEIFPVELTEPARS